MQLRRHSTVPLYRQMEATFLQRMNSGDLRPGERLPTETELARQWNVNRLTVRQAIGELARAGRVTVRRGAGTYVAEPPLRVEVDLPPLPTTEAEISSSEAFAAQGRQLHEVVTAVLADDLPATAEKLGFREAGTTRIDTVTADADTPWMVSSYWLDGARFPGIAEIAAGDAPVYQTLRDRYGVRLRYAWRSLIATSASAADAEVLDVPPGSPIMLREGLNIDDTGLPTLYLTRRMRGDRIKYVLRYDTTR
jgi:DNA-binding GntR family transcriptional regulator